MMRWRLWLRWTWGICGDDLDTSRLGLWSWRNSRRGLVSTGVRMAKFVDINAGLTGLTAAVRLLVFFMFSFATQCQSKYQLLLYSDKISPSAQVFSNH